MVAHTANGDEWSPPFGIFWHQAFQRWRPPITRLDLTWIYLNPERIDELPTESYRAVMMCGVFGDVWWCLVMFGNVWWFLLKMVWARLQGINPDVELRPEICIDLLHLIPCPLDRTSYDNVWHAAHWCSLYLIVQVRNIQHEHYISRKLRPPVALPGRWDWKATNHFDTQILTSTARGSRLERIENGGLEKQRVDLVLSCAWA
jgi:hypothetical protein